jgi:DNA polymerase
MDAILEALSSELRRLKAAGVKTVAISPESLAALRQMAEAAPRRDSRLASAAGAATAIGADPAEPPPRRPMSAAVAPPLAPAAPSLPPSAIPRTASSAAPASASPRRAEPAEPPAATAAPKLPPPQSFSIPAGAKAERMAALRERIFADPVCRQHVRPGKKLVVGTGSLDAKLFFCGEAPGAEEETQGEPFVGPAGQLLTRMIQAMGVRREDVYIGNIMNWRPDLPTAEGQEQMGNRPPTTEELQYCLPFLRAQLEIVAPDVIVALGSTAAQGLLGAGSFKALGEVRGRWSEFAGKPVMVTYHPSYILRNGSNRSKRAIWEDLLLVMERVGLAISEKQRGFFLDRT